MKLLCAGCDRLVDVAGFRVEGERWVLTCPRCGVEETLLPLGDPTVVLQSAPQDRGAPSLRTERAEADAHVEREAPKSGPPADGDPFGVPPGHCPKCAAPRRTAEGACPSCGLRPEQLKPEHLAPSAWLAEQWPTLIARWNDPAAHAALLKAAGPRGELAAVGRLFRLRLARFPGDGQAERGRDEVLRLAALPALEALPQTALRGPARLRAGLIGGLAILIALLSLVTLWQLVR